jgi:hypothetical protein
MTKHSSFERQRRAAESVRMAEIQRAWTASIPSAVAAAFEMEVAAVHARGPIPRQPDMAPGTLPRPPRPGHEPKPSKEETTPRRRY